MMKRLLLTLLLLLPGSTLAQQDRFQVVVTIHPWYDLVRQLSGDLADVHRLLPVGASPHHYDPTARDIIQVASADLIVRNGGAFLDDWVLPLFSGSGSQARLLAIADEVDFEPLGTAHDHDHAHEDADDHDASDHESEGYANPHIWLDVTIAMDAVALLGATLAELDPGNAEAYRHNTDLLLSDLAELDAQLLELLEPVRGEVFVPFHDAWPYFAERYGLDLQLELEPVPGREPSPEYLMQALKAIRESGAKAIFAERQLPTRPAEVVAAEAGLPLYVLDPEGGGASENETYQELLLHNARVLLEALTD